ncbi:hypothetical protein BRARA_I01243 [Brassica rapa]|uniref:TIR domain-containing protein n=1 Tax=Brassica campestris TaxID=3711 RepID=A0A397XT83_BRACM|nr:disease resistance protein RML1A-like [Brassica napus]RID44452.1 hypothetical protein BRARA_I01243 [Brassica rapa]
MASSSLKYNLFASFYGQGLRQTFLSHLCRQLNENGITVFTNQDLVRGEPVLPSLVQRIRESRISIVVLSQKYASSSWCLNELVEILRCRETMGHIVMTIFYRVDPSHVRNQTGDFGNIFVQTCAGKTEEERRMWSQALTDVGNIAGEDSRNWDNESKMIEKIVRDVSDKLNATMWAKTGYSTGMALLVVINLLLEIASAGADQLSSTRKPYFSKVSLLMSVLSLILSTLDFTYKIRAHKARFRFKWPMPWFYYPSRGYNRIFGSSTDAILFFCVAGQLIVSTINCSFTERGRDGPIKISVWPLFFAIGMVVSKFMEKPTISKES